MPDLTKSEERLMRDQHGKVFVLVSIRLGTGAAPLLDERNDIGGRHL